MKEAGPYIEHRFDQGVEDILKNRGVGWLSFAIHTSIAWPQDDVALNYEGCWYILKGVDPSKNHGACLLVQYDSEEDKKLKVKKTYLFASILGWFKGGVVDVENYISSSHPCIYGGSTILGLTTQAGTKNFSCNYMPVISSDKTRKALAYWREGIKLRNLHEGYSFLSFYKVIESQFTKGREKGNWITNAIPELTNTAKERVDELQNAKIDVSTHIFVSGRCAVAHATEGEENIDPDSVEDKLRLHKDMPIIIALARKYISEVLCVPTQLELLDLRDSLLPLKEIISHSHLQELKQGGSILRRKLELNKQIVSIAIWPDKPMPQLEKLRLEVIRAHNGIAHIYATSNNESLKLAFCLDFVNGKAHTNLEGSIIKANSTPEQEVAYLEFTKNVICNQTIELHLESKEIITCEVVIPVNIDIGNSVRAIDSRIKELSQVTYKNSLQLN